MEKVNQILSKLTISKEEILSLVEITSEEKFFKRNDSNSWSLAQVIKHLILVDQGILTRIKESKNYPPKKVSFFKKILPFELLIPIRFIKFKAPSFVDPINVEGMKKEDIIFEYRKSREELVQYSNDNLEMLKNLTPKHPILGFLNLAGILEFVLGHERRHEKQVRELIG